MIRDTRRESGQFVALLEGQRVSADSDPHAVAALRLVGHLEGLGADLAERTALADDVRARQRARLMAVAHTQGVTPPPTPVRRGLPRRTRRLALAAAAAAIVVTGSGVAVAASRSLPGEPFYGVKRGTEQVQLALARGDSAEGNLRLGIARTRLHEVEGLAHGRDAVAGGSGIGALSWGPDASRISDTLADMDEQTRAGTKLLVSVARDHGDEALLQKVWAFADDQAVRLDQLRPDLPTASQARVQGSLVLVAGVKQQMQDLLSSGLGRTGASPPPSAPPAPRSSGSPQQPPSRTNTVPAPVPSPPAPGAVVDPGTAPDPSSPPDVPAPPDNPSAAPADPVPPADPSPPVAPPTEPAPDPTASTVDDVPPVLPQADLTGPVAPAPPADVPPLLTDAAQDSATAAP